MNYESILSPREREVAFLVARGLSNKEIAHELRLSLGTIKLHVHSIFLKIGAHKRYALFGLMRGSEVAESTNWR